MQVVRSVAAMVFVALTALGCSTGGSTPSTTSESTTTVEVTTTTREVIATTTTSSTTTTLPPTTTTLAPAPPPPAPLPAPPPAAATGCDPNYTGCVPPFPPDVNCPQVAGPVQVIGADVHGLDRDGDGVACE